MAANVTDLDRINDQMALTLLPVIVIISAYMVIGISGNFLVAVYYGCHVKPTPTNHFIVAMAMFDLIICCVSMPLEIVDMEFPFKFPSTIACKILRFVNYFAGMASALTLVAIATDRYRKVCQPFKTQITMKMTKILIGITCLLSLSGSWPVLLFYDVVPVNITSASDIVGYDCTTLRNTKLKLYIAIYNGVCFIFFLGTITSITVLYILIGRKLCLLKTIPVSATKGKCENVSYTPQTSSIDEGKLSNRHATEPPALQHKSTHITCQTISSIQPAKKISTENDLSQKRNKEPANNVTRKLIEKLYNEDELSNSGGHQKGDSDSRIKDKRSESLKNSESVAVNNNSKLKTRTRRSFYILQRQIQINDQYIYLRNYTLLMLSITAAFILSFLPYLGLVTWRTLVPQYEGNTLSNSELVAFYTFMRSWMISSVVNPVIYGFFNTDFRVFVSAPFYRCFCCMK